MQGKARLERAIDTVQMAAMQDSHAYYGQGVQSRRDYAHRAEEALKSARKKARDEGWNKERAIAEAERVFDAYNNKSYTEISQKRTIRESPQQLHDACNKPHVHRADWWEMMPLFCQKKTIKIGQMGMIRTEINKVRYVYVVDAQDWNAIKHYGEVVMYYDREDLSRVQLFTATANALDEQFICEATEQEALKRFGPKADRDTAKTGNAIARIRSIEKQIEQDLAEASDIAEGADALVFGILSKDKKEAAETAYWRQRFNGATVGVALINEDDEDETPVRRTSNSYRRRY
jgi:hypothetical protein